MDDWIIKFLVIRGWGGFILGDLKTTDGTFPKLENRNRYLDKKYYILVLVRCINLFILAYLK